MANATIIGNNSSNAATVTNATDGNGTPSRNPNDVSVQTSNAGVNSFVSGAFFDVDFLGGNDSLIASNMTWANPASGDSVAFDSINMGSGDDLVDLTRSAFQDFVNMGDGNDTLNLDNSGGRNAFMGFGNDLTRVDLSQASASSEEELAQKVGQAPVNIDGGFGTDTLDLAGDWTLTLATGNFTLDTDNNGTGDFVTNVLRADQYGQVLNMPALLSGTVQWDDTVTLSNGSTVVSQATFSNFEALDAVCFTPGTMIDTPDGTVAVEDLREGDLVTTREGPMPIRWIGKRRLDLVDLMANPKLLPVLVPAGALGDGLPVRDVHFSPQHRVSVRSRIVERMFDTEEVLVGVKQLVGVGGIEVDGEVRQITYLHFMLDRHAVVTAEGIGAETLYPGPQALRFLNKDARAELKAIFPELLEDTQPAIPALPLLKGREGRALAARHARACQPLWS